MNPAPAAQELILIIDDSAIAVRLLSEMVHEQAATIFSLDGREGIELARERRPDLILLDVEMKGMDGYQVCRALKNDPDLKDIAVIFVTASSTADSEIAALEAGAADFIAKPFNPAVVKARVRTHLQLQSALRALEHLARVDGLTGLFNRRHFDEQIEREILRHRRQQLPLALAFIDIDCFKNYNDHYGHPDGDGCLAAVARLIAAASQRPDELVARYGGEEFVVLLPYTGLQAAAEFGLRLCQSVRAAAMPHAASKVTAHVTISVGVVAAVPQAGIEAPDLLARADAALYRAKAGGRDQVCALPFDQD